MSNNLVDSQEQLKKLVENISISISHKSIDLDNILNVCLTAMKLVESIPSLTGGEKKILVLDALQEVLKNSDIDLTILTLIPKFIDIAVELDRKRIVIQAEIEKHVKSCCALV